MLDTATINKNGYLVTHNQRSDKEPLNVIRRTYACTDYDGLSELILHLTWRAIDTYPLSRSGMPVILDIGMTHPLHIYTGKEKR